MALFDVYVEVDYLDAAERTSTREYLLRLQYDDTIPNWGAVQGQAEDLIIGLNVLTMAEISEYRVIMAVPGSGSANVAANNQVVAFSRALDVNGDKSSLEVPSWDDTVFDENNQNVLSDAYDTAVAAVMLQLRAPETGENFALGPEYSQSRTRKSRNIIHD